MTRLGFGLLATALATGAILAQQDFDKVEISATNVTGKIYMLQGAGGNIGASVGEDGILIVDDQFKPLAEKIRKALQDIKAGQLKFILNTHWHGDHTGSNEVFGTEAPIVAHTNVRKRLSTGQDLLGRHVDAAPPEAWPVITFDDSVSIHFNGEEIRVIHFPHGHTDGDSVIFFTGSNVVHMGDDFFQGRFPFVDLSSGGNVLGLIQNLEKVIGMLPEDVKIIPGHGQLSTLADLKAYHKTIVESVEVVREGMRQGKSLKEIQTQGLPEKFAEWGSGFINTDNWLEIVYRSLIG